MRSLSMLVLLWYLASSAFAGQGNASYPPPVEGEYVIENFRFETGEILPRLRLHYTTIGKPIRDASGAVRNAVLIMHGTTGSGRNFISNQFAGGLFGPGQLLDATKYYIILPDAIGHGRSSKPSDGLHMRFPRYTYNDMVAAQHRILTEHLDVKHLRLVMGTSMGGMMTWVWGTTYPGFMDALMPLASLPVEIAGRNRMIRKMAIDSIRDDPEWKGGEYESQPRRGLTGAIHMLIIMVSSPLQWQLAAPTRVAAEAFLESRINRYLTTLDANDMIYQYEASREYNPAPLLEKIHVPLYAVNSADDQVNPPELGILEKEIKRVKRGRYILIPISDRTNGHGTHSMPSIWGKYLEELLAESRPASEGGKNPQHAK